jgi:hypothetical protein
MNPKISAGFVVGASLFLLLSLSENGNARRKEVSSTRRVIIDRRSFVSEESSTDGGSQLKKELGRMGVRLPDGFTLPQETEDSHPSFEGRVRESRPRVLEAPRRLPAGLTEEHTLRMEGEGAPVELVFGKMGSPGASVRSRLLSSGWESLSSEKDPGGMRVLQFLHGKEAVIACLDEAEGTFLLFREVGR